MKWDDKTKNFLARVFFIALVALMGYLSFIGKASAQTRAERAEEKINQLLPALKDALKETNPEFAKIRNALIFNDIPHIGFPRVLNALPLLNDFQKK